MIKFLVITELEAIDLASNEKETYTPCYDELLNYYIYTDGDIGNTVKFTLEVADGLTPINPSKPMFPRK